MTPRLKELYFKKIQTSLKEKFAFKGVNDPNFKDFLASLKAKKGGDFN